MTDVEPDVVQPHPDIVGWCYLCNAEYQGDAVMHFTDIHPAPAIKPKTAKISWQARLDNISQVIEEIRAEPDNTIKLNRLDTEVIQELYLVRAKLAQMKRNKEGTDNGSS